MKYCKDCKHYNNDANSFDIKCLASTRAVVNFIHGERVVYLNVMEARDNGPCGLEGRLWEPSKFYKLKQWFTKLLGTNK